MPLIAARFAGAERRVASVAWVRWLIGPDACAAMDSCSPVTRPDFSTRLLVTGSTRPCEARSSPRQSRRGPESRRPFGEPSLLLRRRPRARLPSETKGALVGAGLPPQPALMNYAAGLSSSDRMSQRRSPVCSAISSPREKHSRRVFSPSCCDPDRRRRAAVRHRRHMPVRTCAVAWCAWAASDRPGWD